MSKKKTTRTSSTPAATKPWKTLILEALRLFAGQSMTLSELYRAVETHPDFEERSKRNKDPRARIRNCLQSLRDKGRLGWKAEEKGIWRVPEDLTV